MRRAGTLLALLPALTVTAVLFLGALGLGLAASFGLRPFGASEPGTAAWTRLLAMPGLGDAVLRTLVVASLATLLGTALGVALALLLRSGGAGRRLTALMQVNLAVPHVVVAVGTLYLLAQSGLIARLAHVAGLIDGPAGFPALTFDPWSIGILFAYTVKEAPFVAALVLAQTAAIGRDHTDLARSLGASGWQAFRHVLWPLIRPTVLLAAGIVFAFVLGAYEIPALLGASRPKLVPVLATEMFLGADIAGRPAAIALSLATAVVGAAAVGLLLAAGYGRGSAGDLPGRRQRSGGEPR